jgi:hypothetical protein
VEEEEQEEEVVPGYGCSAELDASSLFHPQHRRLLLIAVVIIKVEKLWTCISERRKPRRLVFNINTSSCSLP